MSKKVIQVSDGVNGMTLYRNNFFRLCKLLGLPYHSLKNQKFPILYKHFYIEKKEIL